MHKYYYIHILTRATVFMQFFRRKHQDLAEVRSPEVVKYTKLSAGNALKTEQTMYFGQHSLGDWGFGAKSLAGALLSIEKRPFLLAPMAIGCCSVEAMGCQIEAPVRLRYCLLNRCHVLHYCLAYPGVVAKKLSEK